MITVRINLAHVQATLGRLAAARELLLQTLAECRDTGNRRMEAIAQANLSGTWVDAGDCEAGYAAAMEGLRLAALIGESRTAAWAHNGAQYAAYGLGRLEQALEHARCAEEGFRTQGDPASARINAAAAARNLQALGRADEARAAAEALLAEADAAADGWDGAYELAYLLHQALAPLGHPRATSLLQAAYDSLNAVAEQMAAHVSRAEFLGQVLTHRNICAAWQAAQPSPPDRP
jgi:hypothetical protein